METIIQRAQKIEFVEISKLILNPKNRNKHPPEQIDLLVKLIRYQGFREPLTCSNQSGQVVGGEGRILAARKLKMTHLPVIWQDFDTPDMEYAHGIALNAAARQAALDFAAINVDVPELGPDFDIDLLGIKDFVLEPADFAPGTENDQGRLDRTQILECPRCQEHFEKSEAKIIA